jgi:cation transport ATPase
MSISIAAGVLISCSTSSGNSGKSPPKPDPAPVSRSVSTADDHAAKAQELLKQAEALLSKIKEAEQALPHVTGARGEVDSIRAELSQAKSGVTSLQSQIDTLSSNYEKRIEESASKLAASEKQVEKLKNEMTRKLRFMLVGFAATLYLAAVGAICAQIWLGFVSGWKVAAACFIGGSIMSCFAAYLDRIIFWTGIVLITAVALTIAYCLLQVWKHKPTKTFGFKVIEEIPESGKM